MLVTLQILPYIIMTNLRNVVFIVITITDDETENQKGSFSLYNQHLFPTSLKEEKEEEK